MIVVKSTKIFLEESEIPERWYNISPDLPELGACLDPVLNPENNEPAKPEQLMPLFAEALVEQEVSQQRWIDIPEPVREAYNLWRPTPLYRAHRWEERLDTPARIYYKYEGVSPTGSHKPNTAVPQAFYNQREGTRRVVTETGAGQWGSALAYASQKEGLDCRVFMVRVSYEQKPYRKVMMQNWEGDVIPSPSKLTKSGRDILKDDPDSTGSLGIAISEAVEEAAQDSETKYCLGSVLNHVILHQTVIGQEVIKQLEKVEDNWLNNAVVIGCAGGGSNLGGFSFPLIHHNQKNNGSVEFRAVEPAAAPSLTEGNYEYDFGDTAGLTPLLKMHTLGHDFVPAPIHSGGLRYHGMNPQISALVESGVINPFNVTQNPVFEACVEFNQTEGILPAPEPGHALWAARKEALKCRETGEEKVIIFNLCGHGHFDLTAYEEYRAGKLIDHEYTPTGQAVETDG